MDILFCEYFFIYKQIHVNIIYMRACKQDDVSVCLSTFFPNVLVKANQL